jgi:hypothetical protein
LLSCCMSEKPGLMVMAWRRSRQLRRRFNME